MRHPEGYAQHTALFDVAINPDGDEMIFRTTMGSPSSYPQGGNDIKDVGEITIGEVHGLQSNILEYLEPNSPTFDEDTDDSGSAMGLSSLETIDQEQFTWRNVERTDGNNPCGRTSR